MSDGEKSNVKFEDLKIIKNLIQDVENGDGAPRNRRFNHRITDKYRKISNSDTIITTGRKNSLPKLRTLSRSLDHKSNSNANKTGSLLNMVRSADSLYFDFFERGADPDNADANSVRSFEVNAKKTRRDGSGKQKIKYSSINVDEIQSAAKKEKVKNNVKQVRPRAKKCKRNKCKSAVFRGEAAARKPHVPENARAPPRSINKRYRARVPLFPRIKETIERVFGFSSNLSRSHRPKTTGTKRTINASKRKQLKSGVFLY